MKNVQGLKIEKVSGFFYVTSVGPVDGAGFPTTVFHGVGCRTWSGAKNLLDRMELAQRDAAR